MKAGLLLIKLVSVVASLAVTTEACAQTRGIVGREAPSWRVDQWFNLPKDRTAIDVGDYRGKVIYLYGFQSWCPGCHSRGFPTLKELIKRFNGNADVAFVAIQTAFEGFQTNTAESALKTTKRYELDIPIGHSGTDGQRSRLMNDYRTGGTPWTIIIDRRGIVRFNDFHITEDDGEQLIRRLINEAAPDDIGASGKIAMLPKSRGGQDRVGTKFPKIEFTRWISPTPVPGSDDNPNSAAPGTIEAPANPDAKTQRQPKATLYRWWTDGCPHCQASLPAVEALRRKYADRGLRVVGVYHPKPPRAVEDADIRSVATAHGYHGEIAVDEEWSVLREAYLRWADRSATSISMLVDAQGVIRFVHPGPEFFESGDPTSSRQSEDYRMIERAIQQLLDAKASTQPTTSR
ncbi:MAG: redoxin family protein [Phycisphaerales bacterium]|nr:redoxin family protein [Phycisphaerales bacterium]